MRSERAQALEDAKAAASDLRAQVDYETSLLPGARQSMLLHLRALNGALARLESEAGR